MGNVNLFKTGPDPRRHLPRQQYYRCTIFDIAFATELSVDNVIKRRRSGRFKAKNLLSIAKFIISERVKYPDRKLSQEDRIVNLKRRHRGELKQARYKFTINDIAETAGIDIEIVKDLIKRRKLNPYSIFELSAFIFQKRFLKKTN